MYIYKNSKQLTFKKKFRDLFYFEFYMYAIYIYYINLKIT